jgi:hypothetical protein
VIGQPIVRRDSNPRTSLYLIRRLFIKSAPVIPSAGAEAKAKKPESRELHITTPHHDKEISFHGNRYRSVRYRGEKMSSKRSKSYHNKEIFRLRPEQRGAALKMTMIFLVKHGASVYSQNRVLCSAVRRERNLNRRISNR